MVHYTTHEQFRSCVLIREYDLTVNDQRSNSPALNCSDRHRTRPILLLHSTVLPIKETSAMDFHDPN